MSNLRFIERDGKKILQQWVDKKPHIKDPLDTLNCCDWVDVPFVNEVNGKSGAFVFDETTSKVKKDTERKSGFTEALRTEVERFNVLIEARKIEQVNKQREEYSNLKDVVESMHTPKECNCYNCQKAKVIDSVKIVPGTNLEEFLKISNEVYEKVQNIKFDEDVKCLSSLLNELYEGIKNADKTVYGDIKQAGIWLKNCKKVTRKEWSEAYTYVKKWLQMNNHDEMCTHWFGTIGGAKIEEPTKLNISDLHANDYYVIGE